MSLRDWQRNSWLVEHKSSPEEIAALFAIVERDLASAKVAGLGDDWRLSIGYNAALQAATAAPCRVRLSRGARTAPLSDHSKSCAHDRLAGRQQCFFANDNGDVGGDAGRVDRAVGRDRAVQGAVGFQE